MFKLSLLVPAFTALVTTIGCVSDHVGTSTTAHAIEAPDEVPDGSGDCDPAPPPRPPSCFIADQVCGVNPVFIAQEVYSQLTPGCGPVEAAITIGVDVVAIELDEPAQAAAVWACDVLSCMAPSSPAIAAAQATCAAGTAAAGVIDCWSARALCENELLNQQPVSCQGIEHDYPCPYSPSVQACADGAPRDETDLVVDCGAVVDGYDDVSGPTAGQCVAECVNNSRDAGENCAP